MIRKRRKRIDFKRGLFSNFAGKGQRGVALPKDKRTTFNQESNFSIVYNFIPAIINQPNFPLSIPQSNGEHGILLGNSHESSYAQLGHYLNSLSLDYREKVGRLSRLTLVYEGAIKEMRFYTGTTLVGSKTVVNSFEIGGKGLFFGYAESEEQLAHKYGFPTTHVKAAFFNNLIDRKNGTPTLDFIKAINSAGNWIPKPLHPYCVADYCFQETNGNVIYDRVENYNYAKKTNLYTRFGADAGNGFQGFGGFTRTDGTTPPLEYPYIDSNYFDAAVFFIAPNYSVPRIAQKIHNLPDGNYRFTYQVKQNAGYCKVMIFNHGTNEVLAEYTSEVGVFDVPDVVFNVAGGNLRTEVRYYDGNQTRVFTERIENLGLTANHIKLLGYDGELMPDPNFETENFAGWQAYGATGTFSRSTANFPGGALKFNSDGNGDTLFGRTFQGEYGTYEIRAKGLNDQGVIRVGSDPAYGGGETLLSGSQTHVNGEIRFVFYYPNSFPSLHVTALFNLEWDYISVVKIEQPKFIDLKNKQPFPANLFNINTADSTNGERFIYSTTAKLAAWRNYEQPISVVSEVYIKKITGYGANLFANCVISSGGYGLGFSVVNSQVDLAKVVLMVRNTGPQTSSAGTIGSIATFEFSRKLIEKKHVVIGFRRTAMVDDNSVYDFFIGKKKIGTFNYARPGFSVADQESQNVYAKVILGAHAYDYGGVLASEIAYGRVAVSTNAEPDSFFINAANSIFPNPANTVFYCDLRHRFSASLPFMDLSPNPVLLNSQNLELETYYQGGRGLIEPETGLPENSRALQKQGDFNIYRWQGNYFAGLKALPNENFGIRLVYKPIKGADPGWQFLIYGNPDPDGYGATETTWWIEYGAHYCGINIGSTSCTVFLDFSEHAGELVDAYIERIGYKKIRVTAFGKSKTFDYSSPPGGLWYTPSDFNLNMIYSINLNSANGSLWSALSFYKGNYTKREKVDFTANGRLKNIPLTRLHGHFYFGAAANYLVPDFTGKNNALPVPYATVLDPASPDYAIKNLND